MKKFQKIYQLYLLKNRPIGELHYVFYSDWLIIRDFLCKFVTVLPPKM